MSQLTLRPLSFGEILDGAFTLYRRHFSVLFGTAFLAYLPLVVGWSLVTVAALVSSAEVATVLLGLFSLLLFPYSVIIMPLAWGALVHQLSEAYTQHPTSIGDGFRRAARRYWPLLGVTLLGWILFGVGLMLLIIPGVLIGIMLFAVYPAVVVEDRGPIEAMGRSRELAKGAWKKIFAVLVVATLIVTLPSLAVFGTMGFSAAFAGPESTEVLETPLVNAATQLLSTLITSLTTPFFAASIVLLYYDRRVRTEGLDLEMAADSLSLSS